MLEVPAKTILSGYMEHGWFGVNYNMNIYRGCCHGCIYCDSRSDCYRIENFDVVRKKENALAVIERDLRAKRKTGLVMTGGMSDPYNPFEEKEGLTRRALQLLDRFQFGVMIVTKSDLVVRDVAYLKAIQAHSPAVVGFTITTAEDALCKKIEQRVCPTSQRLEAIRKLTAEGISCGVLLMPTLPFINDTEKNIRDIVSLAKEAGAKWIYAERSFAVSLRDNQRMHFYNKLQELAVSEAHSPASPGVKDPFPVEFADMKERYWKTFRNQYWCPSPNKNLWNCFVKACQDYKMVWDHKEIETIIQSEFVYKQIELF